MDDMMVQKMMHRAAGVAFSTLANAPEIKKPESWSACRAEFLTYIQARFSRIYHAPAS
jgi:hypothetical protein